MEKLLHPGNVPDRVVVLSLNHRGLWMKISITFFLFSIFGLQLMFAHAANSQGLEDETVTLEALGKALPTVFEEIENQTTYRFAYNANLLEGYLVYLDKGKRSLAQSLYLILKDKPLKYELVNEKFIVVTNLSTRPIESISVPFLYFPTS